jgi:transcriptional regulator with XRE-family HTH domain
MRRKSQEIKGLLGFTQEEMAQLLKLHRNTFSRFELGKAPIPQASTVLLGAMLRYIESPEAKAELPAALEEQEALQVERMEKLIKENEYQYERLSRKLTKAQANYDYNEKATKVLYFLQERAAELPEVSPDLLRMLHNRVKASFKKQSKADVLALELQVDLLVYQKMLLERKQYQIGVKANENNASQEFKD